MKTLATFFVTLLLLAGSAWAQTQTPTGSAAVDNFPVLAKAASNSGNDIIDELVVWASDDQLGHGYELKAAKLQKPSDVSLVDAYIAAGREAVRQGIARGYTAIGSTATVWTSDRTYLMRFQTGNGIVLVSFEGGGGIQ